jgi:hypothetical protein
MRRIIFGILIVLCLFYFAYSVTSPSHLHADHKMEYCGGSDCHDVDSDACPGGLDFPDADYLEYCPQVMGSINLHAQMVPYECDRCHQYGKKPMYSNCNLCHVEHHDLTDVGIDISDSECITCHSSHTLITDESCEKCHSKEYDELKTQGAAHNELNNSCYSCHTKHAYSIKCLECHDVVHGSGISTDCVECHEPHTPTDFNFTVVTADQCEQCHIDIVNEFMDHPTQHSNVSCVECHKDHKSVGDCYDCHENVHPQLSESDMDKCSGCHGDAHSPSRFG